MIKSLNITGLRHVKQILDDLKPRDKMIDLFPEDSSEYEEAAAEIGEQLHEIEEFMLGMQNITKVDFANADIRMMAYWKYLREEISFENLLKSLKEHSSG